MKVLSYDQEKNFIILIPTSLEDLLFLYDFIDKKDLVSGKTHRVIKFGDAQEEKEKVQIDVTIEAEEKFLDFQKGCLHVSGRIVEGPEDIEGIKGKLQTVSILINREYKIRKKTEDKFKWILLFRRLEEKGRRLIILAVDSEEATLAIVPEVGEVEVQSFLGVSSDKRDLKAREHLLSSFLDELEKSIVRRLKALDAPIIITGPGFVKEKLAERLKSYDDLRHKIVAVVSSTSASIAGVNEVIKSEVVGKALGEFKAYKEAKAVEDLLKQLGHDPSLILFNVEKIREFAQKGAISLLLLVDNITSILSPNVYSLLNEALVEVEGHGGAVILVNSKSEAGKKLRSLGGIAAMLRYKIF
ncbi:MAG: mRNA surveillance protein pelota [Thermoproteota archaeon]